jgi:hypothetical protein
MPLNPVDSFAVDHPGGGERNVQLLWGDLTQMAPSQAVDVLVVSALPGDYTPTPGSLIGALAQAGVSVQQLSQNKARSWEPLMPCWISQPIQSATVRAQRILVYEPSNPAQNAATQAWMIFQALACFYGAQATSVAMPLVCTGAGGADAQQVLAALEWAGVHYGGSATAPLTSARIVPYTQADASQLAPAFAQIKANYANVFGLALPGPYAQYANQAKQRIAGVQLPASLTTRQAVAVSIYSTNYYDWINKTLRNLQPSNPEYQRMYPLFEAIDTGLANMVAHLGTTYRSEDMTPARENEYQPGVTITNLAYTSSSLGQIWFGRDKLIIAGIDGREIWSYSVYPNEQEVLFARPFVFRVETRSCVSSGCTFGIKELVTNWCGGGRNA